MSSSSDASSAINEAMLMLAAQPQALFLGQGVAYPGHALYTHLEGIPKEKRIEFPVTEELQLGCSIGLAMQGFLPISIFPRMDFLLRAADQLVNHLDKIEQMSYGDWVPKVIIRTRVGSRTPLDAGPQHTQNYCQAFRQMLQTLRVFEIKSEGEVMPVYKMALDSHRSSIVVENLCS